MNQVLYLVIISFRYSTQVLGSNDIFQHLKNQRSRMGDQATISIKQINQILTKKWKSICINIKNTLEICLLNLISINMLALHGVEPKA